MRPKTFINHWFFLGLGLSLGLVFGIRLVNWPAGVAAQGGDNAFTYQGWLQQPGAGDLNASCGFQFELYDALTLGNLIGVPDSISQTLTLEKGYFTTALDFGDVFSGGQDRYLQVAVRCPGDTGYTTMEPRIAIRARPYARTVAWAGVTDQPTINTYSAGFGLDETVAANNTEFRVDTTVIQNRAIGSCTDDEKLLQIREDGTIRCEPDLDTKFFAGDGLKLITTTTTNTFKVDFSWAQRRVAPCSANRILREIRQDGSVTCVPFAREIIAGAGLTSTVTAPNNVRLDIVQGGITTTMLADNSVTSSKIVDGEVRSPDLEDGAVNTVHISTGTILFEDLAESACAQNQVLEYGGSAEGWRCTDPNPYTIGDGLQEVDRVLSVKVSDFAGAGLEDDGNNNLRVIFGSSGSSTTVARSDHNHNAGYDLTTGHFQQNGGLTADNTTNINILAPAFTLNQASDCLVIADMNIYNTTGGTSPNHAAWLRTSRGSNIDGGVNFDFDGSQDSPAVSVNFPHTNVSGSTRFGCYLGIENKSINDDESYTCRVSYMCQSR